MTIYMVVGDNSEAGYEDYKEWDEEAFASKKSAEDYIQKRTNDEIAENEELKRKGWYDPNLNYLTNYHIVEFDVHE